MKRVSSDVMLARAGVGKRYRRASWEGLTPELVEPVVAYCEEIEHHLYEGTGLVLVGAHGTGKTCAQVLVVDLALRVVLQVGPPGHQHHPEPAQVEWISGSVLGRILNRPGDQDHPARIRAFETCHLLMIDDFHKLYADRRGWNLGQLEALMDIRHAGCLATCLTLNTLRLLKTALAGVEDRLRECSVVASLGKDVQSRRGVDEADTA